jgi:hypothetical protein
MNKKNKTQNQYPSFFSFLAEKKQKKKILFIGVFYLIAYIALIYLYPFADGISDTGGYIQSAAQNKYLGYRPFGYSAFLIMLHNISGSMSFLVFAQYWLSAISTILLVFTVKYFYRPKNNMAELFFDIFAVCSITTIYLTNCILSDSLFTSLTILWVFSGIWFIHTPEISVKTIFFFIHILLLGFLFSVRFTGLFYVFITGLIIFITLFKEKRILSIAFISIAVLVFYLLYRGQTNSTYQLTKIKSFSAFSGWQMANNALHVIPYVDIDTNKITNKEVREFTIFAISCKTQIKQNIDLTPYYSTATFIWDKNLPLKRFLFYKMQQRNGEYLTTFTSLGENVYGKFAAYMIKQHPIAYFTHYILPNALSVLYPNHDDVYETSYSGNIPADMLKSWFGMDEKTTLHANSGIIKKLSSFFSVFQVISWLLVFLSVIFHLIKKNYKQWSLTQNRIYWSMVFFVFSYLAFNVYAAPFATRYICPVHILQMTIIYLALNCFGFKSQAE